MSSDTAIRFRNVGKCYKVGAAQSGGNFRYKSLGERMGQFARHPLRSIGGGGAVADDEFWALRDVSFDVPRGEVVGVIGRNGAGKSTLLKILSQITKPTEGEIEVHGRVGSLLEVGTGFHPELTGRENVFLNGSILGMTRREVKRKFDEIVAFSEVEQFLDTPVKQYSSGMYTRLAFAVAAHLDPEILVVDEVLAVGDAEFQKKCLGKMQDVSRGGRTVLFVSHNMAAVQNLCTNGVVLKSGSVAFCGGIEDAITQYTQNVMTENSGDFDLTLESRQQVVLQRLQMFDSHGNQTDSFASRDQITFRVTYRADEPLENPTFGIRVDSPIGQPIFSLSTHYQCDTIASVPSEGVIECTVESLSLAPGMYNIAIGCSVQGTRLDLVEGGASFMVEARDVFGTGKLPPTANGYTLVDGAWNLPMA